MVFVKTPARSIARTVLRETRVAPLTFGWLGLLFVTTVLQRRLPSALLDRWLEADSTNLANLGHNPIRVMITSLLWIAGGQWLPYAVLFVLISARVESWLGSWRWLAVGMLGQVLASLISEGYVGLLIRAGSLPASMEHTMDFGVSYFLATLAGVLTYRIRGVWRWVHLAAMLGLIALASSGDFDFTTLGHLCSLGIGLACCPIARQIPQRSLSEAAPAEVMSEARPWASAAPRRPGRAADAPTRR